MDYLSAFKEGMRENGPVEGTHFVIEHRYGEGHYERFPALIDELLKHDPAVIMVVTIASVRAAQQATKTVPIVFVSTNDPLGSGLVTSLARPGGNTTGLSNQNEDLVNKYVELLHEAPAPRAARRGPGQPGQPVEPEDVQARARRPRRRSGSRSRSRCCCARTR